MVAYLRNILIISLLFFSSSLFSYDDTPNCLRRLETRYFEETHLEQVFNMHKVWQSTWAPIKRDLKKRSREVPRLVYEEGKKYRPNPIDHPFNPKEAEKIVIRVLYAVFRQTMLGYDFLNEGDIRDMFLYIKAERQAELKACLYQNQ